MLCEFGETGYCEKFDLLVRIHETFGEGRVDCSLVGVEEGTDGIGMCRQERI